MSNEITVRNSDDSFVNEAVEAIRNGQALAYSSLQGNDQQTRLQILEAVTTSEPFSEHLGETIAIQDIIIQIIPLVDATTGEMVDQPRILFIAEDGTAYHAVSGGLLRSVNNLIGIMGEPSTWEAPVAATFTQAGTGTRRYFTLKFGSAAKGSAKK